MKMITIQNEKKLESLSHTNEKLWSQLADLKIKEKQAKIDMDKKDRDYNAL